MRAETIYHELRGDKSRERESLVNPTRALGLARPVKPGSLAEKIDTQHPVAAALISHLFGELMCCERRDQFPDHDAASTLNGATLGTKTNASSAFTFPTTSFVNVIWTRDSDGKMTVLVNGSEYMSVSSSSVSSYDTLQLGGRGFVSATPATYTFSFDNVQLSSIPEPRTAAVWFGGISALTVAMYRRR
ncbi:MAG: hypothetical protein ABII82_02330 [Verrucomicrobiota bacterium]